MSANTFLSSVSGQAGPVNAILAVILITAVSLVGVMVSNGLSESTQLSSGDDFYEVQQDIVNGTKDAMELSSTLQIVVIASAVLGALIAIAVIVR